MDQVEYSDFKKLDMKTGKIVEVSRVPKSDNLYKLKVDIGKEQPIQIVSSLVPHYTQDELLNKRIIVLVNLKPTKLCGELSEGMLLCAEKEDESECLLLTPEKEIDNGTPVT